MMPMEVCLVDDISQGKEKLPIRAINGVDEERPLSFTYITDIVYPSRYQLIEAIGCNCIDACFDSNQCSCVLKNEGEIPFNEKGYIIRARPIVHECGLSCKFPPSCMNRVSQHGPRYQLEIFKTASRGWGVRSRNYISSGSFICEYVGELLKEKEAEQRIGKDEYLFDVSDGWDEGESEIFIDPHMSNDGFAIDAARMGNIGRLINHSCSPNLYAQEVLYDHQDKHMSHIMFFATKSIPSLHELTYDYNYKVGRVCDGNGNIKTKDCYCGSRKCTGRMY
ncbi:UNVERIFIED_CONTAM: Histone-lysine N-methyltransferase, H3 lysine-9 specific SUVH5 [Sesamum latifolium]|uniref:Histone-lysine N-methyltransferase, H3 lysine-9 specific SUVH5 n=1 Tax=Sesamum latifolium TaxID=2727402 RepID=A0AAW2T9S0_9LAMI